MRILEVLADCGHADTLRGIAEQNDILECWIERSEEEARCSMRLLVRVEKQQVVLDAIQAALSGSEGWRILIKPVEAIIPRPPELEVSTSGPPIKYCDSMTRSTTSRTSSLIPSWTSPWSR